MFKNIKIYFISLSIIITLMPFVAHSLRAKPKIYTGNPKTIAHDFLEFEKKFGTNSKHYEIINDLINKAVGIINPKKNYTTEEAIKTMLTIDYLLKKEGYVFANNLLLNRGLETKVIDCDNYCAIYIAISEVLRLPVIPVYAPNHSFLRFNFNDGSYLNWETTKGKPEPDSYYIKTMSIPVDSIRKGVYMKSLTRKEFIAVEFNNIGAYLMTKKRFSEAIPYFSGAIKYYSVFSSAYHNRGTAYYGTKRKEEALTDLLKAKELNPASGFTSNTLGDIYFDYKEYDKAIEEYKVSIKLDPDNYAPYYSIGLILKIQGREKEAEKWLEKSEEIKNR